MTHSCTFTQHWNACWAGTSRRRGVLALLAATGTPDSIAALGKRKIETLVATGSPRMASPCQLRSLPPSANRPSRSPPPTNTAVSSAGWPASC